MHVGVPTSTVPTDNRSAFMQAYQKCHEPFVRYCSALAYGKMDAQDLVQDVLLSAFQRFDVIEKKNDLLHYLVDGFRRIRSWTRTLLVGTSIVALWCV